VSCFPNKVCSVEELHLVIVPSVSLAFAVMLMFVTLRNWAFAGRTREYLRLRQRLPLQPQIDRYWSRNSHCFLVIRCLAVSVELPSGALSQHSCKESKCLFPNKVFSVEENSTLELFRSVIVAFCSDADVVTKMNWAFCAWTADNLRLEQHLLFSYLW